MLTDNATVDQQVTSLKPGQLVRLGPDTHAERSGDGRVIRFVRTTPDGGFRVFRTVRAGR